MFVCVCVCVRARIHICATLPKRVEHEQKRVCERESRGDHVDRSERERVCVCVCVRDKERERERERESQRAREKGSSRVCLGGCI